MPSVPHAHTKRYARKTSRPRSRTRTCFCVVTRGGYNIRPWCDDPIRSPAKDRRDRCSDPWSPRCQLPLRSAETPRSSCRHTALKTAARKEPWHCSPASLREQSCVWEKWRTTRCTRKRAPAPQAPKVSAANGMLLQPARAHLGPLSLLFRRSGRADNYPARTLAKSHDGCVQSVWEEKVNCRRYLKEAKNNRIANSARDL